MHTEPANLAPLRENSMLCYGPLVSELGGPECMMPQPRHWGACAPPGPSGSAAYAGRDYQLTTANCAAAAAGSVTEQYECERHWCATLL